MQGFTSKREGRTQVNLLFRVGLQLADNKVSGVTALALLDSQSLSKGVPHSILPLKIIFLHTLVVVALTALSDPRSTRLLQLPVYDPRDGIIVLVRLVSQSKHDVLDSIKSMRAVGELETLVGEVLNELNGVVGGFTLSVGGDDEDRGTSFGELIEVLEVVLLWVAYEGSEAELGLGFLCNTDCVLFSSTGLRTVEYDQPLFLKPERSD